MHTLMAFVPQALLALLCLGVFVGLGRCLLSPWKLVYASGLQALFFALCVGMAAVMGYVDLLGGLQLIYAPLLALPVLGLWGLRGLRLSRQEAGPLALIGALLLPILVLTLYPPGLSDDTSYHLPLAQSLLRHHALVVHSNLRFPVNPELAESLYVYGLAWRPSAAQVMPWTALVALALGVAAETQRRFAHRQAALFGFALLIGNQILISLGCICFSDLPLTLFVTAGLFALAWALERDDGGWFVLAGALFGVAAGIKYTAGFAIAPAGLYLLVASRQQFARWLVPLGLLASPWYLRNAWITLNPTWPFLAALFRHESFWNAADYTGMYRDYAGRTSPKTLAGLLALPRMLDGADNNTLHAIPWPIWPGLLAAVVGALRGRLGRLGLYGWVAVAFGAAWFFSLNLVRYAVPIVPVLALLSALGYLDASAQLRSERLASGLRLALVAWSLLASARMVQTLALYRGTPPGDRAQVAAYLQHQAPGSETVLRMSREVGRTYALNLEGFNFYGEGQLVGGEFGPARYRDTLALVGQPEALARRLKSLDCSFLMLDPRDLDRPGPLAASGAARLGALVASGAFAPFYQGPVFTVLAIR